MLVLPNRDVWTFEALDDTVELEDSVFLAGNDGPRRTAQIVIRQDCAARSLGSLELRALDDVALGDSGQTQCAPRAGIAAIGKSGQARLAGLDVAIQSEEMNVPGFDFHSLQGFDPKRYSVHVNGPWCITFEFEDGEACRVEFEQYH